MIKKKYKFNVKISKFNVSNAIVLKNEKIKKKKCDDEKSRI